MKGNRIRLIFALVVIVTLTGIAASSISFRTPEVPVVGIGGVSPMAATVSATGSQTYRVSVYSSANVPVNSHISVEFIEGSNPDGLLYSIQPADRHQTAVITNPGESTIVTFTLTSMGGSHGTLHNTALVTDAPDGIIIESPDGNSGTSGIAFTVAASTPTPK